MFDTAFGTGAVSDLVERVAIAMFNDTPAASPTSGTHAWKWNEVSDAARSYWRRKAAIALETIGKKTAGP